MPPVSYDVSREKVPRGLSYPLKTSAIDRCLQAGGVTLVRSLSFGSRRLVPDRVILADYYGAALKAYPLAGGAYISIYPVPSHDRHGVEQLLLAEGLPALVRWLADIEHAGNTRRGTTQRFAIFFEAGRLRVGAT